MAGSYSTLICIIIIIYFCLFILPPILIFIALDDCILWVTLAPIQTWDISMSLLGVLMFLIGPKMF